MAVDEVPHSALIIDSPHIERILAGDKTWEMRSRTCNKRGSIGLVRKGSGKIVGLAKVIGVKGPLTRSDILANLDKHRGAREDLDNPALAKYNFAWILSDARPLAQPVHYDHKKGVVVWVTLDDDTREKIANQTGLRFVHGMPPQQRRTQELRGTRNKSSKAREKGASGAGGCVLAATGTIGAMRFPRFFVFQGSEVPSVFRLPRECAHATRFSLC